MKSYGFKNICDVDVFDYLNLKENPKYIDIDKNNKGYHFGINLNDNPLKGFVKVNSIQEIEFELRKHDFIYRKNTSKILKYIQTQLYP
ncbi:hypothetical protein [Flavobacterium crassostreae]|uniref:Uncharacterized protein n=1 Tax=Flavobacterium crassostreae TaxID=1763534 RepID=A0A1B9E7Q7_9FLAO|nr:hypothetical protein [Flavobacterium crassostreae]OCB77941.1 hypothetical protein LPBF_03065 [Flavobacterium crassostreae]